MGSVVWTVVVSNLIVSKSFTLLLALLLVVCGPFYWVCGGFLFCYCCVLLRSTIIIINLSTNDSFGLNNIEGKGLKTIQAL